MFTIRRAILHDISEIKNINEESLLENYDTDTYVKHIELYNATYVVEGPDGLVGYVLGRFEDGVEVHVTSIAVRHEARGHKLGQRLMLALLVQSKKLGMKSCALQVRTRNTVARHIYSKLGFQELRELPNYYEDGEDGILMRRMPL